MNHSIHFLISYFRPILRLHTPLSIRRKSCNSQIPRFFSSSCFYLRHHSFQIPHPVNYSCWLRPRDPSARSDHIARFKLTMRMDLPGLSERKRSIGYRIDLTKKGGTGGWDSAQKRNIRSKRYFPPYISFLPSSRGEYRRRNINNLSIQSSRNIYCFCSILWNKHNKFNSWRIRRQIESHKTLDCKGRFHLNIKLDLNTIGFTMFLWITHGILTSRHLTIFHCIPMLYRVCQGCSRICFKEKLPGPQIL